MPTIFLYGGSFCPPGLHHEAIIRKLANRLGPDDRLIVIPCGPRPDKETTNDLSLAFRAALCDLAFGRIPRVEIDLTDLEHSVFTRSYDIDQRYRALYPNHEICHVIGADIIAGGARGQSEIHRTWFRGQEVWNELHFMVHMRYGVKCVPEDLPPHHTIIEPTLRGSSSEIRERIFKHQSIETLVSPAVAAFMERHQLFTGRVLRGPAKFAEPMQPLIVANDQNANAVSIAAKLASAFQTDPGQHNCVVVIGGDGFMLHTIRRLWRDHVPFFGLNRGTKGFLLNDFDEATIVEKLRACRELKTYTESLLYVEAESVTGEHASMLAFNDAWVDRLSGQTIWTRVLMNGEVKFDPIMSDVMLVSTAAGSTGYAYRMGGSRLIPGTQMLQLVGSCVCSHHWKNEPLPIDTHIRFEAMSKDKRPMRGFCDGVPLGELNSMSIRRSTTATAELAFFPETDLQRRISEL
ncbi:MAG: NAD(+)/NADH kinase [Candidatus Uhrbacteria bacterium]|nr:NAD(+)/NADH kinase [Candidatus Uhrbacteria bacterium]